MMIFLGLAVSQEPPQGGREARRARSLQSPHATGLPARVKGKGGRSARPARLMSRALAFAARRLAMVTTGRRSPAPAVTKEI